ncbi:MAG TPA: NAD-dependent epimerase/dehydratase family protein, partial [Sumerlaeia bacterium]|nr:NAD-dependent epimerase/dehydratase family protein [Sumerlaeia bacterium]
MNIAKEIAAVRVLVSGSSGFIGSALVPFLQERGHRVTRLVRRPAPVGEDEAVWDPRTGVLDRAAIEGHDAVVHLAGESIASGRWTRRKKESIRRSRVEGTRLLSETLARLER